MCVTDIPVRMARRAALSISTFKSISYLQASGVRAGLPGRGGACETLSSVPLPCGMGRADGTRAPGARPRPGDERTLSRVASHLGVEA